MGSSLVTLTTDFKERDPFVASLKGVLLSRCPGIQLVDLSHDIARADAMEAGLFIAKAIPCFPEGTIHLVGVGSGPTPLLISILGQFIACPDNGLITLLAQRHPIEETRAIRIPEEAIVPGRQTMFARDVFAPAVARLISSGSLAEVGDPLEKIHLLDVPEPVLESKDRIRGQFIHIDGYGNLVSNIHQSFLDGYEVDRIDVGDLPISRLSESYAEVPVGSPLAVFGSSDYLEVAYNGDRADQRLAIGKGIFLRLWVRPRK